MMFGFAVGWGVFWLLVWTAVLVVLWPDEINNQDDTKAGAIIGFALSVFYLIALFVGRQFS